MAKKDPPTEIASRLNVAQKKALLDMPDKPRRMRRLSQADATLMVGLCRVGPGWFVMDEMAYRVQAVLRNAA